MSNPSEINTELLEACKSAYDALAQLKGGAVTPAFEQCYRAMIKAEGVLNEQSK